MPFPIGSKPKLVGRDGFSPHTYKDRSQGPDFLRCDSSSPPALTNLLAGLAGFESTTIRLTGERSTVEL